MKMEIKKEMQFLDKKYPVLLKPQSIVDYAKDPKTALHSCFEWDNKKASNEYRLLQARNIIRVFVEEEPLGECKMKQRIRVSLKRDRQKAGGG